MKTFFKKISAVVTALVTTATLSSSYLNCYAEVEWVTDNSSCQKVIIDGIKYRHYIEQPMIYASSIESDVTELNIIDMIDGFPVVDVRVYNNENVTTLNIPATVESIEIKDCPNLGECSVDEKNENYSSVDGVLYDKNIKTLLHYPSCRSGKTYIIPDGVETIGYDEIYDLCAMDSCKYLENIIFPDSVKVINSYSFVNCNFEYLELPDSVALFPCAFESNKKLKEIVVHGENMGCSSNSFWGSEALKTAVFLRTEPFEENYYEYYTSADPEFPDCYGYGAIFGDETSRDVVNDVTIYVPDSSIENYEFALGNIEHYTLVPLSEKPKGETGDVNKNRNIGVFDVLDIQNYFINKRSPEGLDMDVNSDDSVNILDVIMTKQIVNDKTL